MKVGPLLLVVAACGGKYAGPTTPAGIQNAALPYRIVDARTGHDVAESDAWARLAAARAVCVGEEHPNPHHHWAQLHVVEELGRRAKLAGISLALGMEMVQTPFQGVLDDYAAGKIDDAALVSRTGWADRWGYEFEMYRPIIKSALGASAKLIALNAPRELTKKISHDGLGSLSPEEKAALPELKLDDPQHRKWWNDLMADMGGASAHVTKDSDGDGDGGMKDDKAEPAPPAPPDGETEDERFYTVQVLWDESMADGAAKWVVGQSGRSIIIIAGNGHCHDSAIVNRIKRRGVPDAVSVLPIIDDGGNVAAELANPMNDYLFVMTMPASK